MKIRTRIFLVFVLVVVLGFAALVQWVTDDLRPRYLESLEEPLVDFANILAELVAAEIASGSFDLSSLDAIFRQVYRRRFHARIYALEREEVDLRVYLTDTKGIVIFDSTRRDLGADYSRWNDVYRTLQGEYGARATREDPATPEIPVLYVAAPVEVDGELRGVLSVGKPAYNAERFLAVAKRKLILAAVIAGGIVLLLGLGLTIWVSWPLERLIRYARAVKSGERVSLPPLGHSEIGMMGAALEEMRQELAGKDYAQRYVQTLTHELKSPLAAIRGAAELLDEDMPADQQRRFLGNIQREILRIQELVERMLELAALEKRQTLEKVERIDVKDLINDAIASVEPLIRQRQLTIRLESASDMITLRGERFLLRQALVNLLRNALEFSPSDSEVAVAISSAEKRCRIAISDQGSGVPDYALEKVFERFYSLPRPDGGGKSTGLGLSFVREVAELHGGTVSLSNHPEGGAEAVLSLPSER